MVYRAGTYDIFLALGGQARERREEVAGLTMRVEASEGHARMLAEEKEIQIRYGSSNSSSGGGGGDAQI